MILTIALALSARAAGAADAVPAAEAGDPRLTELLSRTSRVASLYRELALKFECTETLEYEAHEDWTPRSGYAKFSYLYDRDATGRFEDCRLPRKGLTRSEKTRCVLPDDYRIPAYLSNAYLWIFAFLEKRQAGHEYRLAGEETVLGRPSLVVDYGPKGEVRANFNDWYGRAWIDRESGQLLRVRAFRPKHWQAKRELDRARTAAPDDDAAAKEYEVEWVVTEFDQEKGGLRFASEVEIHRARYRRIAGYKEERLLDVRQTYAKYRLYQVASREEIRRIVEGGPASRPVP